MIDHPRQVSVMRGLNEYLASGSPLKQSMSNFHAHGPEQHRSLSIRLSPCQISLVRNDAPAQKVRSQERVGDECGCFDDVFWGILDAKLTQTRSPSSASRSGLHRIHEHDFVRTRAPHGKISLVLPLGSFLAVCTPHTIVSPLPRVLTMDTKTKPPKRHNNVLSSLNMAIDTANLAGGILSDLSAKAVCGSISILLTAIKVCFLPTRVDGLLAKTHLGFYD